MIAQEHGVDTAIQCIYRDLDYAKSLIKGRNGKTADDAVEDSEESWTFIGDDGDLEVVNRFRDWESMAQSGTLAAKSLDAKSAGGDVLA
jgi:sterol 3beta-glucosyltransferase